MTTSSDYTIGGSHLLPRSSGAPDHDDTERGLLAHDKDEEYRDEPDTPRLPSPAQPVFRRRPLTICARLLGVLPWIVVGMVLAWMMSAFFYQVKPFKTDVTILKDHGEGQEPEPQHNDTLPAGPMPVIVTDKAGNTRWTVSIPSSLEFPLKPEDYSDICAKAHMVSAHLDEEEHNGPGHHSYYHVDEKFLDVPEAEEQELLPTNPVLEYSSHWSKPYDTGDSPADSAGYCKRSMTYVLESHDAGLGATLLRLWAAYGLAKKEGRAFFIDDRNWAYGRYEEFFQPPPDEGCLPPPDNRKLPCPHHAKHLVVSEGTQGYTFGHQFTEKFEDPKKMEVERQINIFGMMREGYEALYRLVDGDKAYLDKRIKELDVQVREHGGIEVGVHVRHGDRHPLEFAFEKSYIPLDRFVDTAWEEAEAAHDDAWMADEDKRDAVFRNLHASRMILASDDPLVYSSDEMDLAVPAQELIKLSEEPPLDPSAGSKAPPPWDGGFTAEKFWSMGTTPVPEEPERLRSFVRDFGEDNQRVQPATEALKRRARIARAYFLDLAVLGQTDRVVCTVSSVGCRLVAIMMGWEKAIEQEHWVNIDGDWHWSGIRW